jgi:hypothetical protein
MGIKNDANLKINILFAFSSIENFGEAGYEPLKI